MANDSLEQRLANVESQLALLLTASQASGRDWIRRISGSAKADADFAEILRLGKQLRDAEVDLEEPKWVFLFDTDHLGLLQTHSNPGFAKLSQRISGHSSSDFWISIVSFHEQIRGWNAYLAKATDQAGIVKGYRRLELILSDFAQAQVAPFGDAAALVFEDLRSMRIRIGTMDLRIAAIALANGFTLLTRNAVDFAKVPNLSFEDWTIWSISFVAPFAWPIWPCADAIRGFNDGRGSVLARRRRDLLSRSPQYLVKTFLICAAFAE
jgi:tRNA(fMet)-specific endonuclease VapC